MDDVDENTSMNDLKRWKVEQLKDFIRKRGLKVAKRCKDELVAIAYGAIQCGMKTVATAEEKLLMKADIYQTLLETSDGVMPDP